jgi:hypothetical protein
MASAFLPGMIAMGLLTAGLFFFRFWRRTGDRLFIAFGLAFCLLALNQVLLAATGIPREEQSWIYLIRLAAFALIIVAIVGKNMGRAARTDG